MQHFFPLQKCMEEIVLRNPCKQLLSNQRLNVILQTWVHLVPPFVGQWFARGLQLWCPSEVILQVLIAIGTVHQKILVSLWLGFHLVQRRTPYHMLSLCMATNWIDKLVLLSHPRGKTVASVSKVFAELHWVFQMWLYITAAFSLDLVKAGGERALYQHPQTVAVPTPLSVRKFPKGQASSWCHTNITSMMHKEVIVSKNLYWYLLMPHKHHINDA